MNPIGIILVFLFLALLVILGVGLAGVGAFKLRQLARSGFAAGATGATGGGSSESGQWAVVIMVSWQSALIAAGLFLTTYGALAGYRLIWGG